MQVKGNLPLEYVQTKDLSAMVKVYFEFNHLKQLYRQGWLRRGVPPERCESVAEHSFGVAVLALFLADAHRPDLDRDKLLCMALLHDFGEIYAGDLIPTDAIDPAEKHRREARSANQVFGKLTNGPSYVAAWQEYEAGESAEACFIRQIDRLEMALQASVYQHQGLVDPSEFFNSAGQALSDAPQLRELVEQVHDLKRP
jgi:putative hydrolase of HD superfamily